MVLMAPENGVPPSIAAWNASLYVLYATFTFGPQVKPRAVPAISEAGVSKSGWFGSITGGCSSAGPVCPAVAAGYTPEMVTSASSASGEVLSQVTNSTACSRYSQSVVMAVPEPPQ